MLTIAREITLLNDGDDSDASLRDVTVRYLAVGTASRLLHAIRIVEDRQGAGTWDATALGILRTRYYGLLRSLAARTELSPEQQRLGAERVAFYLSRDGMKNIADLVDNILGSAPSVGALLVAEERLRAAIIKE